jgi:DNA-binding NarL/FixJ family response regulator
VTIRILVVDDQPVVRAGVATMLGTQHDLAVVGDAADGLAAVAMAARLRPDVVVMDIRMPQLTGIEATRRVVALGPAAPRVVLLTTFDLDEYIFDGLLVDEQRQRFRTGGGIRRAQCGLGTGGQPPERHPPAGPLLR